MGKIFAIGGGEIGYQGAPIETTAIDKEIIKTSGKKNPRLLFLPTASEDSEDYCKQIEIHFGGRLGCDVDHLLLSISPTHAEMREKVEAADIIYVGGGDTMMMMGKWRENRLDSLLMQSYSNGTILAGLSAGAICWFKYGSSDSLKVKDPTQPYIVVEGLGLQNGLITPHFDVEDGRPESQKELLRELDVVGIGIDECAALEINDDRFRIITAKDSKGVTKSFWVGGRYHFHTLPPGEYGNLVDLNSIHD